MKIHEYQAKEILKKFGVPVPRGEVAATVEEAIKIARGLKLPVVVKAQIHAGGRGKGGGIKIAKTVEEVEKHARAILGMKLVTHQTGPEGRIVKSILVAEAAAIERELYLGAVLDRASSSVTILASAEGGVDIEEVARKNPEKILKVSVDPEKGVHKGEVRKMAEKLNLKGALGGQFESIMEAIYKTYVAVDCSLVEINPLAVAGDTLVAVDAKMNLDDNALFRHPDYEGLRDPDEEDPKEIEAKKFGLSYISLNGNIGCMVNGAGLAMATMDLIQHAGGEPANFLDVGGGATSGQVTVGFKIILADPKVKAVLVNIFGGIMRCDVIADGIVAATKEAHIKVPVVVRLQGTNVDLGKKILRESGLNLVSEDNLGEAARKAVQHVDSR